MGFSQQATPTLHCDVGGVDFVVPSYDESVVGDGLWWEDHVPQCSEITVLVLVNKLKVVSTVSVELVAWWRKKGMEGGRGVMEGEREGERVMERERERRVMEGESGVMEGGRERKREGERWGGK